MYSLRNVEKITYYRGLTIPLLEKYEELIEWPSLQYHPEFSIDWYFRFPEKSWRLNFSYLSTHPNFDISWVSKLKSEKWNNNAIYNHPNFDISWVLMGLVEPIGLNLSMHKNFKIDWVLKYPNYDWKIFYVSSHKDLDIDLVEKYPNWDWNFSTLSLNRNFDISWVEKYPNENWLFFYISSHKNWKFDWVRKHPDLPWHWYMFNLKNFEIEWYEEFTDKNWIFNKISKSVNFKIEWVKKYPNKYWNFKHLSKHPNFKIEWVDNFPLKNWDWKEICKNKNTKLCDVKRYIHNIESSWIQYNPNFNDEWLTAFNISWDWNAIIYRDLSVKCIRENYRKIDFYELSKSKHIKLETINDFPNEYYSYYSLYKNNNLSLEWIDIIYERIPSPILSLFYTEKNISTDFIRKNIDKIDWYSYSKNKHVLLEYLDYFNNIHLYNIPLEINLFYFRKLTEEFKTELYGVSIHPDFPMGKLHVLEMEKRYK